MVSTQWLLQPLHRVMEVVYFRPVILSSGSMEVSLALSAGCMCQRSLAISAAPKAPMMPAMSGRTASQPEIFSKLRSTASL